jgi:hypothetical protein
MDTGMPTPIKVNYAARARISCFTVTPFVSGAACSSLIVRSSPYFHYPTYDRTARLHRSNHAIDSVLRSSGQMVLYPTARLDKTAPGQHQPVGHSPPRRLDPARMSLSLGFTDFPEVDRVIQSAAAKCANWSACALMKDGRAVARTT